MLSNTLQHKKSRCLGTIVHKLCSRFHREMMSLRANNNNYLAHFLSRLQPALCLIFFLPCLQSPSKQDSLTHTHAHTRARAHTQKHTEVILKMAEERSNASKADGGQINKAFGYFKKMSEEACRQPRAVPRLQLCVYLESYS